MRRKESSSWLLKLDNVKPGSIEIPSTMIVENLVDEIFPAVNDTSYKCAILAPTNACSFQVNKDVLAKLEKPSKVFIGVIGQNMPMDVLNNLTHIIDALEKSRHLHWSVQWNENDCEKDAPVESCGTNSCINFCRLNTSYSPSET